MSSIAAQKANDLVRKRSCLREAPRNILPKPGYARHLRLNLVVACGSLREACRQLVLAAFHLAHAILPIGATEHARWGIGEE